jgi:DNA-binding LacI/PurR family transcriptional regulator
LSAGLLAAVEAAGLKCPADVSVAVLGQPKDRPDVTGFEVSRRELGRRAVRLLVDQITGSRRTDQQLLEYLPVPGATAGPV